MKRALLNKYFNDQCTARELEKVLSWFQTEEGRAYIEQDIKKANRHNKKKDEFIYRPIDSKKVFNRIQRNKRHQTQRKDRVYLRVASILLLVGVISFFLYKGMAGGTHFWGSEPDYITYVVQEGHHKIISLSDGTTISLNEGARLVVPEHFGEESREVKLVGEAFFEVAHQAERPFIVNAIGSTVRVLGTKFNVKTDTAAHRVQVAVLRGRVELKKNAVNAPGAILTRNTFGVLNLNRNEITIERIDTGNYISWLSGRLTFSGQRLLDISRQLEYIYGISIGFESKELKDLKLTAAFDKEKAEITLGIIANTLDIKIAKNDTGYVWTRN